MQNINISKKFIALLFIIPQIQVSADTGVDIISALDFGEIVVLNDAAVHTVQVTSTGGYNTEGGIYTLEAGHPAELYFYGYPAYTHLYFDVSFASTGLTNYNNNATFQLEVEPVDEYKITDGNGATTLKVGATLKTSGTNDDYVNSDYVGYFRVTVVYY